MADEYQINLIVWRTDLKTTHEEVEKVFGENDYFIKKGALKIILPLDSVYSEDGPDSGLEPSFLIAKVKEIKYTVNEDKKSADIDLSLRVQRQNTGYALNFFRNPSSGWIPSFNDLPVIGA